MIPDVIGIWLREHIDQEMADYHGQYGYDTPEMTVALLAVGVPQSLLDLSRQLGWQPSVHRPTEPEILAQMDAALGLSPGRRFAPSLIDLDLSRKRANNARRAKAYRDRSARKKSR